jgi:hypothetical protein
MEMNIDALMITLSTLTKGETPKRKAQVIELITVLLNYPNTTITLDQAEKLEITARQITWLRQIFYFKLK